MTGLRNVAAGRGVLIGASGLGKAKMVAQVVAILLFLLSPPYPLLRLPALVALGVVVVLTLVSGADYFLRFYREVLRRAGSRSEAAAEQRTTNNNSDPGGAVGAGPQNMNAGGSRPYEDPALESNADGSPTRGRSAGRLLGGQSGPRPR